MPYRNEKGALLIELEVLEWSLSYSGGYYGSTTCQASLIMVSRCRRDEIRDVNVGDHLVSS